MRHKQGQGSERASVFDFTNLNKVPTCNTKAIDGTSVEDATRKTRR